MKVLVVASRKGGVGKTTISGHLGVQAELAGDGPVALIDADPQGSLAEWWNAREEQTPAFVQVAIETLAETLGKMKKAGVKLVIIDTPPAVSDLIEKVVKLADLVLIPTRPGPHDLRAVSSTVQLVEATGRKMVFVINGAANRAKIAGEAAVVLSQYGTVAPVTIHQRTPFASSMIDGRTVMETEQGGRSAEEVEKLWEYISGRLKL